MGENHSYPMIAFGTLKKSSAFKMYAKSQNVPYDEANEVSKQIGLYEKALKHCDNEEEKKSIDIYDFVDRKYEKYIEGSKKYQGIINSKSQAPSAWLIYSGDIKREIGLIKCKSESTGKEVITTVIDGMVAEHYKFVKNDLLKVDVWLTINKIFDKIGIKTYTVPEITEIVENDKETWDIYANGYTLGVNQCESKFGKSCCKRYKPKSLQELTMLVAGLRPGFKSMLDNFLDRKPYTNGVKELDDLLNDSFHYICFQENIMTYLGWLGIEQTETYAIIKQIAKKKFKDDELRELKTRLLNFWIENVGTEEGFETTWQIVYDASRYVFNASHAYSYAYDSVYGAYLKAHYPYEFYSVILQSLSEKGKKDKVIEYKKEMLEAFGIKEGKYKWGLDNREFSIDKENNSINPSLISLKDISQDFANELWEVGKDDNTDNLFDLFKLITSMRTSNKTKIQALINCNYFQDFCDFPKANKLYKVFVDWNGKKTIKKDKLDSIPFNVDLIRKYSKETDKQFSSCDMDTILREYFNEEVKKEDNSIIVIEVTQSNPKYHPRAVLYSTKTKKMHEVRLYRQDYAERPVKLYSEIKLTNKVKKPKSIPNGDGGFIKDKEHPETWISYEVLND